MEREYKFTVTWNRALESSHTMVHEIRGEHIVVGGEGENKRLGGSCHHSAGDEVKDSTKGTQAESAHKWEGPGTSVGTVTIWIERTKVRDVQWCPALTVYNLSKGFLVFIISLCTSLAQVVFASFINPIPFHCDTNSERNSHSSLPRGSWDLETLSSLGSEPLFV